MTALTFCKEANPDDSKFDELGIQKRLKRVVVLYIKKGARLKKDEFEEKVLMSTVKLEVHELISEL